MNSRRIHHARQAIVLAAICAVSAPVGASRPQAARAQEFVGSTPCGPEMRAFIGGLGREAPCHAVTWKLSMDAPQNGQGAWRLSAVYGVPPAANPNAMVDGPRVTLDGTWTSDTAAGGRHTTYRLTTGTPQRVLSVAKVADGLVHVLDTGGRLMIGTAGWSYTLNDATRAERPGNPSLATDMSYTISPVSTGSSVFAVFEGRTPCAAISRAIGLPENTGCLKVKWRITLYQSPPSSAPATYKIESTLHRQQPREGAWRIVRGLAADPNAVVYQLDPTPTEGAIHLLRADDNVLYFLNPQKQALVGTVDFSYTLNRRVEPPAGMQQKPNFAGRWVQLSPSLGAGSEQVVQQTEATLTATHDSEGGGHSFAYRLDGSETRSTMKSHGLDIVTVSTAIWKGDRLTITSTSTYTPERKLDQTFVWSIDEKGQLVVDLTQTMTGRLTEKQQIIYRKR